MDIQELKEGRKITENKHFWADIQKNLAKYRAYTQYEGLQCRNCKRKEAFSFHGYYRGRKRYKCKCGVTVNDFSQSLIHRSRHPEKWNDFIAMAISGASLGQMSKKLKLSKVTLYRWRKKLFQLAAEFYQQRLQGIIVAEEIELTSQEKPKFMRNVTHKGKDPIQLFLIIAKDRRGNILFQIKQNRSKLWRAFMHQVHKKSTVHANVAKSALPSDTVPKKMRFFGPSEGSNTVEKQNWSSPVSEFLFQFAQASSIYRGITAKYLTGYLGLLGLKHKLQKTSNEQRKAFSMYTLLTNNMRVAMELAFNGT